MDQVNIPPKQKRVVSRSSEESYAGPALSISYPLTSPSSSRPVAKRLRRTRGTPDDDQPQEDDEIRNEEFRAGGPQLCNLPAISVIIFRDCPFVAAWDNGMRQLTIDILYSHKIDFQDITLLARKDARESEAMTIAFAETIFIQATKRSGEDWRSVCKDIRKLCIQRQLPDVSVEIADARGLQAVRSFAVNPQDMIYKSWPSIKKPIIEILGSRPWVALELLRRGKGATAEENTNTIVITIETSSQFDWTEVREQIVELLEADNFEDIAVEIGRGGIYRLAQKDARVLPTDAYEIGAKIGTSIGPRGNDESAGTFCCYVEIQPSPSNEWHTYGLTCHSVILPSSSNHPSKDKWDKHGIMPNEPDNDLEMDMPSRQDHSATVEDWKSIIQLFETEDHKTTRSRLRDPEDFVPPYLKKEFQTLEPSIVTLKEKVQMAEAIFQKGSERLGSVYASSGLRLSSASPDSRISVDWALLKIAPERSSHNFFPSTGDASQSVRSRFIRITKTMSAIQEVLSPRMPVFFKGRSSGFTMGLFEDKKLTTLQSWKENENGTLIQQVSEDYRALQIKPLYSAGSTMFAQGGDLGSAVMTYTGAFVGLFFAGNDYTGSGYITCAADIFSDIKRVTLANDIKLQGFPDEE